MQDSTITLHAPEGATFTNYGINGAQGTASFQQGQHDATIKVHGPMSAGDEVEVVAEWPHGIVAGQPNPGSSKWMPQAAQQAQEQQFQQRWGPVLNLGLVGLGSAHRYRRAGAALPVVVPPGARSSRWA